ncbi:non-canonical purine NTP diphosphatase [Spongiivirga citrea]|uniref:dITP/XTP pyrophosphatase n=1 Tax=Spongiivirga citrea TaxID=1481457 RepID=A0A6M0CIC4_9FLAO|nr:non-canonical purine NTP diphosphatase [Spongiivirga citrea]NER17631.1 non-canonical purine NTP diphosphatase [Spongiivirga citrea]
MDDSIEELELVFATHNENKFIEVAAQLPNHIKLLSLDDIGCVEDIPETGDTIEENAILKADYVKEHYKKDCFADDTGLEVVALEGAPGVYSKRYAGDDATADDNMNKLIQSLEHITKRNATFKTVIALAIGGEKTLFVGEVNGSITHKRHGEKGFGYDPIFKPDGFEETFAQMSLTQKSEIGHRGRAMRQLIDYLK